MKKTPITIKDIDEEIDNLTTGRGILETFNSSFPLLQKVYAVYEATPEISKDQENTLRRSVEMTTLEILELIVVATRQTGSLKKDSLKHVLTKIDTIKVFIDLGKQTGIMDQTAAQNILDELNKIGRMIEGWNNKI